MKSEVMKLAKLQRKELAAARIERVLKAIGNGLVSLLQQPLLAGVGTYAVISVAQRFTDGKGEPLISDGVAIALKSVAGAYPMAMALGGYAGLAAGAATAGALAVVQAKQNDVAQAASDNLARFSIDPNAPEGWTPDQGGLWAAHQP